jgi:hypothetical protein
MTLRVAHVLGAVCLATTTAATPLPLQDVAKAKALRCFIQSGVVLESEPGKPIQYKSDNFSKNPTDSLVTVDVVNERLTGNAGAVDVAIIHGLKSTDIFNRTETGNLIIYSVFQDIEVDMPKAAGGFAITKGYRMVMSRHVVIGGRPAFSQYLGVCAVTD